MDEIVPWAHLCEVIEPFYAKGIGGRPPVGLERMLRMHFVQHWFNLADQACEEALLDSTSLCRFVGIDLRCERVPDGTALLKFRSQGELTAGKAPQACDFTNQRVNRKSAVVDEVKRRKNRNKSKIRSRVEHVFGVVKRLWGFSKVRYRGLQKNATRAFTALALSNIFMCRARPTAQVRP